MAAIRAGKLQYRETSLYGNPFLRLIRSEVESLVAEKHGPDYVNQKKYAHELAQVNKVLKELKTQLATLESRKAELLKLMKG